MRLDRVVELLAPLDVVGLRDVDVRDLAYDTRAVRPGCLFFCVAGARADGHDHAGQAVAEGAVGLVVERPVDVPVPQIVVGSVRAAMPVVADEHFGRPSQELTVAGVTGTNGKTTTAYLLHAILDAAGRRPGLLGNIERRVGDERRPSGLNTPEAIDLQRLLREMVDAGNLSCALEASSHASEKRRLDRVRFASLAFTNLTRDHLDFHGTMERYFDAKRRLFTSDDRPPAAVNVGDPWGRRLAEELVRAGGRVLTFVAGGKRDADLRADAVEVGPAGTSLRVNGLELHTRLRGGFNVENVMAAVASARLLGLADDAVAAGVEALQGVPGRLEPVDAGQPFAVLVDYAHTPDSLRAALEAARELGSGRVLVVFGAGGDRDRAKRPEMGAIAAALADTAVVTSDNPRSEDPDEIAAAVLSGGAGLRLEPDRRRAIERALEEARAGDVVLIAGKGHERGQEIAGVVHPFDDREVAREALRALAAA